MRDRVGHCSGYQPTSAGTASVLDQTQWTPDAQKKKGVTHPALLAGLWVFLSMQEVWQAYSPEELHELKMTARRFLARVV